MWTNYTRDIANAQFAIISTTLDFVRKKNKPRKNEGSGISWSDEDAKKATFFKMEYTFRQRMSLLI